MTSTPALIDTTHLLTLDVARLRDVLRYHDDPVTLHALAELDRHLSDLARLVLQCGTLQEGDQFERPQERLPQPL